MFTYNKKEREIKSVLYNEIDTPNREEMQISAAR
jgi:hypothetical protein